MRSRIFPKGFLILFVLLFLCTWALPTDGWARAGGGSSIGSRGSRTGAAPTPYTAPKPVQPSPTPGMTGTPRPTPSPMAQPSSFWRSFGGGLLGGLVGGMLFRSLFGGAGGYGGIGLMDILLLAGIAFLIYWYIKKKRQQAASAPEYYQSGTGSVEMPYQPPYPPASDRPQETAASRDLERGLANIRQFDPDFDPAKFQDMCMDTFFQIQGAWANRDMSTIKNLLTAEMYGILQQDADQLKAQKIINRLENIAVRSVDPTEAWQESGADFITVRMYANLLDYNVDETTGQVIDGSKTEPVKFEEYWTFTRPVGNNPWQLSAIQQAT
jgi:predicted lipid-binding transport protein (Tim44 family)